jgi:hypothetical protein
MERMTLAEYGPGDPFIKPLVLMDAKEGKTSFLFMSLLGLWPWQQHGGVVSDPAHLHFIALDTACMDRIIPRDPPDGRSLMEMAGVPMKTIDYVRSRVDVIKMDKEVAAVMNSAASYNHDWFKAMKLLRQDLASRMKDPKETHAVVMSSWTTMCHHHERCLFGSPTGQGESNAYGTQNLWTMLKEQFREVRLIFQALPSHMFWEGHVSKQAVPNSKPPAFEDTLSIHGGAKEWPKNTSHNFRVVRETVQWKDKNGKSTLINPMYVNPKPSYSFVPGGGRGVGALAEKEPDLTKMMMDMGYQVGGWKP